MKLFGSSPPRKTVRSAPVLRLVKTPPRERLRAVPTSETAECTCPESCERDHDNE